MTSQTIQTIQRPLPPPGAVSAGMPALRFGAYLPEQAEVMDRFVREQGADLAITGLIRQAFRTSDNVKAYHPQAAYLEVFSREPLDGLQAVGYLGDGRDALAIELPENQVLKVSYLPLSRPHDPRIDLPVLDAGEVETHHGTVYWSIQPKARLDVTWQERRAFQRYLRGLRSPAYVCDRDFAHGVQLGRYQGQVYLIDERAVIEDIPANRTRIWLARACNTGAALLGADCMYETAPYKVYQFVRDWRRQRTGMFRGDGPDAGQN